MTQNLWDTTKAVITGKLVALNTWCNKNGKINIKEQNIQNEKLRKKIK